MMSCGRDQEPVEVIVAPPPPPPSGPQWVVVEEPMAFVDQLDGDALDLAIEKQIRWFESTSNRNKTFQVGDQQVSAARLKQTLERFQALWLLHKDDPSALSAAIQTAFTVYQLHFDGRPDFLMTGYYAPILDGSLKQDDRFRYPLYQRPKDMLYLDIERFNERILGRGPALRFDRLPVRREGKTILPYFTREEIDGQGALENKGLELIYLDDYWETFLFHVQGGGFVRLNDGTFAKLNYAAQNGQPYRGVGRLLVDRGIIAEDQLSLPAIRAYLETHPDQVMTLCFQNPSYVFYAMERTAHKSLRPEMYPDGSLGFPVTTTRSIAMDKRYFAGGGLYFIRGNQQLAENQKPANIAGAHVSGFVIDQDTGGAIHGGHFDFFTGAGDKAKALAGQLNDQNATIFQLVLKEELNL